MPSKGGPSRNVNSTNAIGKTGNRTVGPAHQHHEHQPPNNEPKFNHVQKAPVVMTSSATIEAPGGPCTETRFHIPPGPKTSMTTRSQAGK